MCQEWVGMIISGMKITRFNARGAVFGGYIPSRMLVHDFCQWRHENFGNSGTHIEALGSNTFDNMELVLRP